MNDYLSDTLEAADMPRMIVDGVQLTDNPAQGDMLLLAMLTAASYAMPHIVINHGKPSHTYHPNLMTLIVAPPASGKGVMNLVRKMLHRIQQDKRAEGEIMAQMTDTQESDVPFITSFIPGNSSSAAFFKILHDNNGCGILFETEMDVLSSTWKHDYANYSYAFRQAFEHETISVARKKGAGLIEVDDPQLSILLSGTQDQLMPLLESRSNGLMSRFICYMVHDIVPFDERAIHHPDESDQEDDNQVIDRIDAELYGLYKWLSGQNHDCRFLLTAGQAEELRKWFDNCYSVAIEYEHLPLEFDPVVKRMVVNILRIGAILQTIKYWESNSDKEKLAETLTCDEGTFRTMMTFAEKLINHACDLMFALPDNSSAQEIKEEVVNTDLLSVLPKSFRTADAIAEGKKLGIGERAVMYLLKDLVKGRMITKAAHGSYVKTKE